MAVDSSVFDGMDEDIQLKEAFGHKHVLDTQSPYSAYPNKQINNTHLHTYTLRNVSWCEAATAVDLNIRNIRYTEHTQSLQILIKCF